MQNKAKIFVFSSIIILLLALALTLTFVVNTEKKIDEKQKELAPNVIPDKKQKALVPNVMPDKEQKELVRIWLQKSAKQHVMPDKEQKELVYNLMNYKKQKKHIDNVINAEKQKRLVHNFMNYATSGCVGYGACKKTSGEKITIQVFREIAYNTDAFNHLLLSDDKKLFLNVFKYVSKKVENELSFQVPIGNPNPFHMENPTQKQKDLIIEVAKKEWKKIAEGKLENSH